MSVTFDGSLVLTAGLLLIRLAAIFLMTPILYSTNIPSSIRVVLLLCLAVLLTLAFPHARVSASIGWDALLAAAFNELIIGAAMGVGIIIAFSAFSMAGGILDFQIGYSLAQIFDPTTRQQMPVLATIFSRLGVVIFFCSDSHHVLLRGIAYSLEVFPPGSTHLAEATMSFAGALIKQISGAFALGFALVAPVVFCLLLVEFGLGILARNLPQMNMFVFGIPIKIVIGLATLALWMVAASGVMARIYENLFQTWAGILQ